MPTRSHRPNARLKGALACAVLACSAPSATAHAWTRTRVTEADAYLYVKGSGEARVSLQLGLQVQGGWLSRFEIALAEPAARLDQDAPAVLLAQDGAVLTPVTTLLPDGRIAFEFPDKQKAAWRGVHTLRVTYFTRLPARASDRAGETELRFTMPAWQVDLEDADVYVTAPRGSRLLPESAPELDGALRTERLERGEHTVLHSKRVQLPRTRGFEVALAVPHGEDPGSATAASTRPLVRAPWLALFTLCAVGLKLLCLRVALRRRGLRAEPLLAMPAWGRFALALGLAGGAAYSTAPQPMLVALMAVVALGLQRRGLLSERTPDPRMPSREAGVAFELFGGTAWLDGTTPLGLCVLASAYALALARMQLTGTPGAPLELALLVTPLFFNATRLDARPTSAGAALRAPDRAA